MPSNILRYLIQLIKDILNGNKVVNPAGSPVAHPANVEIKVLAAANGAVIGGLIGGLVNILPIPEWMKKLIRLALPALGATSAAYLAPHTERALPRKSSPV